MTNIITDFHFIRPLWLSAIFLLFIALYLLRKIKLSQSGWQQFLPAHLAKVLLENTANNNPHAGKNVTQLSLMMPLIIGLMAIIALAGPTWKKLPQPVYQMERGSVLIMDMSYSMYATDLKPNRLTRARFKASDLLEKLNEGDIGLIAYAGDAFVISPLTEDIKNIELLLPSLSPEIMPELGSNPLAALSLADQMLKNSGHLKGDIYWLTDGIDYEDIQDITHWSREFGHQLNILGIGSPNGAPITLPNGELLKDNKGAIVIPKLNESYLAGVAKRGNGVFQTITNDISDITTLLSNRQKVQKNKQTASQQVGDQWQEAGPYLLLFILPLILSYFRRGNLLLILPFCLFLLPSESALATTWQDLWKTKDQQAQEKFAQQQYQAAGQQFENSNWQGSAYYKAKDYDKALQAFKEADPESENADNLYNQGNSLAQLQRIDEAIDAYKKALAINPELTDAKENKEKLEQLKKQQEQQKQQEQDSDQQNNGEQQKQNDNKQNQQGSQQQKGDQQGQEQSDQQQGEQSKDQSQNSQSENDDSTEQDKQQANSQQNQQQSEQEKKSDQQQAQQSGNKAEKSKENTSDNQQLTSAQQEKLDQEVNEKHQQLLNKVTDDPYLLLRNKMQLEYKKRRQEGHRSGVTKKW